MTSDPRPTMDGHPKHMTARDHEIASLKQLIDNLEKENGCLRDFCIEQHKKLTALENRTGWEKFNDSLLTLGEHRIEDAIGKLVEQHHLCDARTGESEGNEGFPLDTQPPKKRRSTLPSSTSHPEIEGRRRVIRRVDSVAALAGRFTSLFKRNWKSKVKDRETAKDDNIVKSVDKEAGEGAKGVMVQYEEQERLGQEHDQHLADEQDACPQVLQPTSKNTIAGEHEQMGSWKLEKAPEEYKKSMETDHSALPVHKGSIRTVSGRHDAGKDSKDVEDELVIALEKEFLASFPKRGSVRTVHWPESSRISGSIFEEPRPRLVASQAPQLPAINTQSRLPAGFSIQAQLLQQQAHSHPTQSPPTIPHKSRPRHSRPRLPPPPPETDDVFRFSHPTTPPSHFTPLAHSPQLQRLRHRRSVPSPTPRFVSHRPSSPSPGGNEPMPPNPNPSWLKTREVRAPGLRGLRG